MKKLISIVLVLVLVLGLMTMTASAEDPMIAGNDVIERANGPDSWTNFYLADGNNPFVEDSVMTGFSAYVARLSPFKFMVFTKVEDVWEVVFESELVEPTELGIYTAELDPAVFVSEGSLIGLFYPTNGAIPYTAGDPHFEYTTISHSVLFTNQNDGPGLEGDSPEVVMFSNSGNRIYSIQALGFAAPESGWLTPIAKDGYMMNVKSTLPIKFRLEGEFEDVKLMVNDVEVEIVLKENEEDGDFYMGLFRTDEPGEYTAIVLVNGAPVLSKEFAVYEVASKAKTQAKIKTVNGLAKGKDK